MDLGQNLESLDRLETAEFVAVLMFINMAGPNSALHSKYLLIFPKMYSQTRPQNHQK